MAPGVWILTCCCWAAGPGLECPLPAEAGVVNVRTEGGAKGDGVTDDTAALRALLGAGKGGAHPRFGAARALYFPNGVYLVSEPLLVGDKKKSLVGESRDGVVLRLRDRSPAFQDPAKPAAVLSTTSSYPGWHFAQNFGQRIHHLTIDVGAGNPGAIALNYHTNNLGDVCDVRLRGDARSADALGADSREPSAREPSARAPASGLVGLQLGGQTGPGLVSHVLIEGFDEAARYGGELHSMTLAHVELRGQRRAGIVNRGNTLSIHALRSRNAVPALEIHGGHVALVDAELQGGAADQAAITFERAVFVARDVRVSGYRHALAGEGRHVAAGKVDTFAWPRVHRLFSDESAAPRGAKPPDENAPALAEALPIEAPPWSALGTPRDWKIVRPASDGDLTKPLQAAIDGGAEYIFIPADAQGEIRDTIRLRGRARVIRGGQSPYRPAGFNDGDKLLSYQPLKIEKAAKKKPVFRLEDGEAPVVLLQMLTDNYGDAAWTIEHASRRALLCHAAGGSYRNTATGGKAFFVDGGPHPGTVIQGPQSVWAWNTNIESYVDDPNILNRGGRLWICGLKSEKDRTLVKTTAGGVTEVWGGLVFKNRERIGQTPAFVFEDAAGLLSYRVTRLPYETHVLETRDGVARRLLQKDVGALMPLFVSSPGR